MIEHQLCAYDRQTERLAATHVVPEDAMPAAMVIAGVDADDPDCAQCYQLSDLEARMLGNLAGVPVDPATYDYTLEGILI